MQFSDFKVRGQKSIPTPPMMALAEIFYVDAETNY